MKITAATALHPARYRQSPLISTCQPHGSAGGYAATNATRDMPSQTTATHPPRPPPALNSPISGRPNSTAISKANRANNDRMRRLSWGMAGEGQGENVYKLVPHSSPRGKEII